jgi:RNA polymerase sigma factor (sigma-70 family)
VTREVADEDPNEWRSESDRRQAMWRFYHEHHPRLRRFVAVRVGERESEDVCQEIWQSFFVNFDSFLRKYGNTGKVLYPIAYHRISDFWRERGRLLEAPVEGENLAQLADAMRPQIAGYRGVDRRIDVEKALVDLTDRQRRALHLHHVDGLTVCDTAALMGVSVNTAKDHLKRALQKLRSASSLDSYLREGGAE